MPTRMDDNIDDVLSRAGLELVRSPKGLVLTDGAMDLLLDFNDLLPRVSQARLGKELLVKAAKLRPQGKREAESTAPFAEERLDHVDARPVLLDATAGLGEDSFLLAAAGFEVFMCEQNPIIYMLLEDACARGIESAELEPIVSHMHAIECDSVETMRGFALEKHRAEDTQRSSSHQRVPEPDVVYLDPMFPTRTKSAAVKKKFQLLHHLERSEDDGAALLDAALALDPRKVIVKRPLKGAYLGDIKPSYSLRGKAIRFDVYA